MFCNVENWKYICTNKTELLDIWIAVIKSLNSDESRWTVRISLILMRSKAVPSGNPNPTRYPTIFSIPDPTRFSFENHRVAGNPKCRIFQVSRSFGYYPIFWVLGQHQFQEVALPHRDSDPNFCQACISAKYFCTICTKFVHKCTNTWWSKCNKARTVKSKAWSLKNNVQENCRIRKEVHP